MSQNNEMRGKGLSFLRMKEKVAAKRESIKKKLEHFKNAQPEEKRSIALDLLFNNAMYIIIALAIIIIAIRQPRFLSTASVVNIISLTASKIPVALGVGGCIVLAGTDISAGRVVGLTAVITASLLQSASYASSIFPGLSPLPIPLVLIISLLAGAAVGCVNGFFVAKFKLHPFIVTLSTQLIVYGLILLYLMLGDNGGQTLSGLDASYLDFVRGPLFRISGIAVPRYVLYSIILTVIVWVIWNKTAFGRNMFAVGSNEEAASVSGVSVFATIIGVFMLAGIMYAFGGFIEGARIASIASSTGLNYESDAIAACVIGGVSFVGGTGRVGGIVIGVLLLQIIFVGLNFLSVDQNMLYIIKGLIILLACAVDMRKYLSRR